MNAILFNLETNAESAHRTHKINWIDVRIIKITEDVIYYTHKNFLRRCSLGASNEIYTYQCAGSLDNDWLWDDIYKVISERYTTSWGSIDWEGSSVELFEAHKRAWQNEMLKEMRGE